MTYSNDLKAKIGLAKILSSKILSPSKSSKIYKAINEMEAIPSKKLLSSYKVKKISPNIYSYRVTSTCRLIFGEKEDKIVILDVFDLGQRQKSKNLIMQAAASSPKKIV